MTKSHSQAKKRIAVFFGGRSPEHDVSIVTGLQILQALDRTKYEAFPVYITPDGAWLTGDVLLKRENYMLDKNNRAAAQEVILDLTAGKTGRLLPKSGLFKKAVEFDAAIPSFHGLYGEDGNFQGILEFAGIPYAGMRTMASAILMDKVATKMFLNAMDIPVLPCAILKRPDSGYHIPKDKIAQALRGAGIDYPCIVKPSHLGSSIGVAKVNNVEEIAACLPPVFEYDDTAIVEPFVPNLIEYNIAVAKIGGQILTSAIERPKAKEELLDFKTKYLSGGGKKTGGAKTSSEGMLSLTRELNPKIAAALEGSIRNWAVRMFDGLDGSGAPRIDFISDAKTGELWLNEVNPWPGSIGYFLWEVAANPILFSELLTILIDEAFELRTARVLPKDPVPVDARLHRRPVH